MPCGMWNGDSGICVVLLFVPETHSSAWSRTVLNALVNTNRGEVPNHIKNWTREGLKGSLHEGYINRLNTKKRVHIRTGNRKGYLSVTGLRFMLVSSAAKMCINQSTKIRFTTTLLLCDEFVKEQIG